MSLINEENLRRAVKNLELNQSDDMIGRYLNQIYGNVSYDSQYLYNNQNIAKLIFTEVFPAYFKQQVSDQHVRNLTSFLYIFSDMCRIMSEHQMFDFAPFLYEIFSISDRIPEKINLEINDRFSIISHVKSDAKVNVYNRLFISVLVKKSIIPNMIIAIPGFESFSKCLIFFKIFNYIFPLIETPYLRNFCTFFQKFEYSLDDPRFNDAEESLMLTKSMMLCSSSDFMTFHIDNIIHFLMAENKSIAKTELISLVQNRRFLTEAANYLNDCIDLLFVSMKEETAFLEDLTNFLITFQKVDKKCFMSKVNNDIYLNLALFNNLKEFYTRELVSQIMNSVPFDCAKSQMVEFGFKVIKFDINLLENPSIFISNSIEYWTENHFEIVEWLAKTDTNRIALLSAFSDLKNLKSKDLLEIGKIISIIRPSNDEFDFDEFMDSFLMNVDSLFILPFLERNDFFIVNDIECLMSFVPFNLRLTNYFLSKYDQYKNRLDFLLDFEINFSDEYENEIERVAGNNIEDFVVFLFTIYKKTNDRRFLWKSFVLNEGKDLTIRSFAQKEINDYPDDCVYEIFDFFQNNNDAEKYFLNFDYSKINDLTIRDDANVFIFHHTKRADEDSFFSLPAKICYSLNHSEKIEENDVRSLFSYQISDDVVDSVILDIAFDASKKIGIEYTPFQEALLLALKVNHASFIKKLINEIDSDYNYIKYLLDKMKNIDESLCVELIERIKIPNDILNSFLIQNNAISIIRKIKNVIPINILKKITFTKQDFLDFVENGRIDPNAILSFYTSKAFPQILRTKKVVNCLLGLFSDKMEIFCNYFKQTQKASKKSLHSVKIENYKFINVYKMMAYIIPTFRNFGSENFSKFLADTLYQPEKINLDSISINKDEHNFDSILDTIFLNLPKSILELFEIWIQLGSNRIAHTYSFEIANGKSVSEIIKAFYIIKCPKILFLKTRNTKFEIEDNISFNGCNFSLSCFITKSEFYTPKRKTGQTFYKMWSNGSKKSKSELDSHPIFICYKQTNFDFNEIEKCKTADFFHSEMQVILDFLHKLNDSEWDKCKPDDKNTLFEIATILYSKYDYKVLFNKYQNNPFFAENFFMTNYWSTKNPKEIEALSRVHPNQSQLIESLKKDINTISKSKSISLILCMHTNSQILNDEASEQIISQITIGFPYYEEFILNHYRNPNSTNFLLLQNDELADFVLRNLKYENVNHLLASPTTDKFLEICLKNLGRSSISTLAQSTTNLHVFIARSLVTEPHTNDLANLFVEIIPDDNDLVEYVDWIEYALSSRNQKIRKHSFKLLESLFTKETLKEVESDKKRYEKLQAVIQNATTKCEFELYFGEVVNFALFHFGKRIFNSLEFSVSMYDALFALKSAPCSLFKVIKFLDEVVPNPPNAMIEFWGMFLSQCNDTEYTLVMISELFFIAIKCEYSPQPDEFKKMLSMFINRVGFEEIEKLFTIFKEKIRDDNISKYFNLIIAFELAIPYYVPFIQSLLGLRIVQESDLIFFEIYLPILVIRQEKATDYYFRGFDDDGSVTLNALFAANVALELLLNDKCTKVSPCSVYIYKYYTRYIIPNFQNIIFIQFSKSKERTNSNKRLEIHKNLLKYILNCCLAFRQILFITIEFLNFNYGIQIFPNYLTKIGNDFAFLCCQIAREVLADVTIDTPENHSKVFGVIDREFNSELYHFNKAEKPYLLFYIAVMKNNKMINSVLPVNQIFLALRNDQNLEEIDKFICMSMEKYDNFFNENEVKSFIIRLTGNDPKLRIKLNMIKNMLNVGSKYFEPIAESIFPKIEELASDDKGENSETIDSIVENLLIMLT